MSTAKEKVSTTCSVKRPIELRSIGFAFFTLVFMISLSAVILEWIEFSLNTGPGRNFSHMVLIPFVSGFLFYQRRDQIFSRPRYSLFGGIIPILVGVIFFYLASGDRFNVNDRLSLMMFSTVVIWTGGFILFYGLSALRAALFPLLFLLFAVPIPNFIFDKIVVVLQQASVELTALFLKGTGMPFLREGTYFLLPGYQIEIAKECSGIRSYLVLLIMSILGGQVFLKTNGSRFALALAIFPIAILQNGLRITTLCVLGVYVYGSFLTSGTHYHMGDVYFVLALLLLFFPTIWLLHKAETRKSVAAHVCD